MAALLHASYSQSMYGIMTEEIVHREIRIDEAVGQGHSVWFGLIDYSAFLAAKAM